MQIRRQLFAILLLISWAAFASSAHANQTNQMFASIGCVPVGNPESQILTDQSLVVRALCKNTHAAVIFVKDKSTPPSVRDCGVAPENYPVLTGDGGFLQMQPCVAWRPVTHFVPDGKGGQTAVPGATKSTAALPRNDGKIIQPPPPAAQTAAPAANNKQDYIKAIHPKIMAALKQKNCDVVGTGMIHNMDMTDMGGGMISTAEVICKDNRAMAGRLEKDQVEIILCTPGKTKAKFKNGIEGDYCPG